MESCIFRQELDRAFQMVLRVHKCLSFDCQYSQQIVGAGLLLVS